MSPGCVDQAVIKILEGCDDVSVPRICGMTGLRFGTIRNSVQRLVEAGVVIRETQNGRYHYKMTNLRGGKIA